MSHHEFNSLECYLGKGYLHVFDFYSLNFTWANCVPWNENFDYRSMQLHVFQEMFVDDILYNDNQLVTFIPNHFYKNLWNLAMFLK